MDGETPKSKDELLDQLLDRGMVMVTLDARQPGVDVPPRLHDDPQLRLNLSYRFGLPLVVNAWGVRATLTFGGTPHRCKLPWRSIYAMTSHANGEQLVFPDDVPQELLELAEEHAAAERAKAEDAKTEERAPEKLRPRLAVVESVPREPASSPAEEVRPEETGVRRAHLRRIK